MPPIKEIFERKQKAVKLRPSVGQGTAVTKVRFRDGLTCEIEDGEWKLVADMASKIGGSNLGPNPGVLGRSALGSCLAITYLLWAAKLDVKIDHLEVEVQADYDARGELGVDDISPDYREIRYSVNIESPAPQKDVLEMIETAEAHCCFLYVFRDPHQIKRKINIENTGVKNGRQITAPHSAVRLG